jgi:hypothetical protein
MRKIEEPEMENEERAALIRKGNELFNKGDYRESLKIFLASNYKDGIIRVADYYYFDKKDAVSAMKLYKRAGHQKIINDFAEKAAAVLHMLLAEDKRREADRKAAVATVVKEWKPVVIQTSEIIQKENKEGEINAVTGRKNHSEGGKGKN